MCFQGAAGREPQFLSPWASLQGCVSVLKTWQLTSFRVSDSRENRQSHNVFYDLSSKVTCHHFGHSLMITHTSPDTVQVGAYTRTTISEEGSTGGLLGAQLPQIHVAATQRKHIVHFLHSRRFPHDFPWSISSASPLQRRGSHYFDLFHHELVLPVLELHVNGIILFWVWLLSLSIVRCVGVRLIFIAYSSNSSIFKKFFYC